jgi:hypothetical protein
LGKENAIEIRSISILFTNLIRMRLKIWQSSIINLGDESNYRRKRFTHLKKRLINQKCSKSWNKQLESASLEKNNTGSLKSCKLNLKLFAANY